MFSIIFSLVCFIIQGQNNVFEPGYIYFKIYDTSSITIPDFDTSYTGSYPYLDQIISNFGVTKIYRPFIVADSSQSSLKTYELLFTDTAGVLSLISSLSTFNFVEYVEKKPIIKFFGFIQDDTLYCDQWYLKSFNADSVWNITKGDSNVIVAVIDNAFRTTHQDLKGKIYKPWDWADNDSNTNVPDSMIINDPHWNHGTHCAGLIGAKTDNKAGIASLGYNIKIMPLKISKNIGNSNSPDPNAALNSINYAINNKVKVISMSWGIDSFSTTLYNAIKRAYDSGIVCVAAVGNVVVGKTLKYGGKIYPAAMNHVIGVGAIDQSDIIAGFSNFGNTIGLDVLAPGTDILSTGAFNDSAYYYYGGTSQATPLVAALCGLMFSKYPNISPDSVEYYLKSSARKLDIENPLYWGKLGAGKIDPVAALNKVKRTGWADFNTDDSTQQACVGISKGFIAYQNSLFQYLWDFGDGTGVFSTLLPNINHTFTNKGIYTITLLIQDRFNFNIIDSFTRQGYINVTNCDSIKSTQTNWIFGKMTWLDFKKGRPKKKQINTLSLSQKPTLVQSDSAGNLLYYIYQYSPNLGGNTMYTRINNSSHNLITNGEISDDAHTDLGITILNLNKDSVKQYYTFYGNEPYLTGDFQFRYNLFKIDRSNSTYDKVIVINKGISGPIGPEYLIIMDSNNNKIDSALKVAPGVIAVPAIPKCDNEFWIIAHGNPEDNIPWRNMFYVFKYNSDGIFYDHIDSSTAIMDEYVFRASPDGSKIALIDSFMYDVLNTNDFFKNLKAHPIIYNFNKLNGKITKEFDLLYGNFGFCFSPNSKLFYVFGIEINNSSYIYQYDMTQPNPNSTVKRIMVGDYNVRSLQLGPDSIIYVNYEDSKTVGAIYFPDSILHSNYSNNCGYVKNAIYLVDSFKQSSHSGWFFPNFIDSRKLNESEIPLDFVFKIINCDSIELCAPFYKNKNYNWYINDILNNTHTRKITLIYTPLYQTYHISLKVSGIDSIYKEFKIDSILDFNLKPEIINCHKGLYDKFTIIRTTDLSKYNFIWSVDTNGTITENYDTMIIVDWNTNSTNLNVYLNVTDIETGCVKNFTFPYLFDTTYSNGYVFDSSSPSHPFILTYYPPNVEQVFVLGQNVIVKNNANIYFPEFPVKVYMKRCARIIVDSASTLNIINLDIFGCRTWNGITATGRPTLNQTKLKINKSRITDALVAVYSQDNALVEIDSSEFWNNLTHIAAFSSPNAQVEINHNSFSGFIEDTIVCNNPYRKYAHPVRKMIYIDSVLSITISNNTFLGFKKDTLLYYAIKGKKIDEIHILNNTFLDTFKNIIDIENNNSSLPDEVSGNRLNGKANNGIKIVDYYFMNITQNKITGKIDTAINIKNSTVIILQNDTLLNTRPYPDNNGLYIKSSSLDMNHCSIRGYNYGIQYYDTYGYNSSISTSLIDSNRIGLIVADSVNPEVYVNSSLYAIKNLTITCNKFYDNTVGILGSGGLRNQGSYIIDAANDFYNCSDWNMIWKNHRKIKYFFNENYSNRTNPLFVATGVPYNIDGIAVDTSKVDSIGISPTNTCFGAWIIFPTLDIKNESGQSVIIYPNPFDNELIIKNYEEQKYLKIEIFDIIGNVIFDQKINNFMTIINTNNWYSGVYLLKITDSNKDVIFKKLIKTN